MFDFTELETLYGYSKIASETIEQKAAEIRKAALHELAVKFVNEITPDMNAVLKVLEETGGTRGVRFVVKPYEIKVERLQNMAAFTLIDDSLDCYTACYTNVEKFTDDLDSRYEYELKMLTDFIRNYDSLKTAFEKEVQVCVMERIQKKNDAADAKLYAALDLKGGGD